MLSVSVQTIGVLGRRVPVLENRLLEQKFNQAELSGDSSIHRSGLG